MHDFLVSAAAFIVLIGIMVVVHEFGHFVVAKLFGVRVEAFSLGFGPRLFGVKYGETDYKVCLLPLGGFVKMTGESPEQNLETPGKPVVQQRVENGLEARASGAAQEVPAFDPGAFTSHPRWQRMLIGFAGPTANFLLAFVLMVWYYGWINEVPSVEVQSTTVDWVIPGSAAAQAGIEPGDTITVFGGVRNPSWDQVYEQSVISPNQYVPVDVERGGKALDLTLHVPADAKSSDFDLGKAGLLPKYLPGAVAIYSVEPGTPAARAGFQPGDGLVSIDGHDFHNIASVQSFLQEDQGKPVSVVLKRGDRMLPPIEVRPAKPQGAWEFGFEWVPPTMHDAPVGLSRALPKSLAYCQDNSFLIVEVVERIFARKVSVSQLSGPIGIAQMAGEAAQMKGWYPKFTLAGEISLNLGILNLLPFPILDGGMIMLLLIESFLRHDISIIVKERIYQVAFVMLVVFFAFIIFNDVTKLPIFAHGRP
ncbi:MAG: RIP metalloprotease RseP [Terracidiphilus sp.]